MSEETVRIEVEFSDSEAWVFAQFLKRAGHSNYLECAADSSEAYQMLFAGEKLRAALAAAGYAPR